MIALRSIRARILAAFVLTLAAFTGALVYGLVTLGDIGEGLAALDSGYLPLAQVAAETEAIARQLDRDHDRIARESPRPVAGRRSSAAFYSSSLADAVNRGRDVVEQAASRLGRPDDREALTVIALSLSRIDGERVAYDSAFESWLASTTEGADQADGRALAELDSRRAALVLESGQLSATVERRIEDVSQRTSASQNRAFVVSSALAGLAVMLAGLMGGVTLLTLRPIGALTERVQRLAAGEKDIRAEVGRDDEIGLLAREFNAMADAVAERDRRLSERAAALDALSLRLRGVIDAIHAGLVVVDEGRVSMANPAAERLWEVREGTRLPSDLALLEPGRYEAHPHGPRLLDIDVVPFEERGRLIVGEDVTQRLQDRERLARSERLAVVGQMLAQITHEVRNPLNAMSLNAELLAEDLEEPESRDMLGTIIEEIGRLEAVTARYLDLSRRRRPMLTVEVGSELVRGVVRMEEEALRRSGVVLELSAPVLPEVELDGDALRRALRNVLRNAVEAGATRISLRVSQDADTLTVELEDDGPGMAVDQIRHAFEPFYTTKARGTGLGLAISRQELEEVGGSLSCISEPGQGTTFVLLVPVLPPPAD